MRKSDRLLDPLFSLLMQQVLAATVGRAGKEWYLSDLASHLEVRPSSLQRLLAGLAEAGILRRRKDGNRVYFSADTRCLIFPELSRMLEKTVSGGAASGLGVEFQDKLPVDL